MDFCRIILNEKCTEVGSLLVEKSEYCIHKAVRKVQDHVKTTVISA